MSLWETRKRKENLATSQCLLTQKTEWCTISLPMEGLHPSLDSLSNRRFCFSVRMGVKHCSEINPMVYLCGWVLKAEQPSSFLASISSAVSPSPSGLLIATGAGGFPPTPFSTAPMRAPTMAGPKAVSWRARCFLPGGPPSSAWLHTWIQSP